jgi:hypothetical protein
MSRFVFLFAFLLTLPACQYEEACDNQICFNGFCTSGVCDCFDWYSGLTCNTEIRSTYYGAYSGYSTSSNSSDSISRVVTLSAQGESLQDFSSDLFNLASFRLHSKDSFDMLPNTVIGTDTAHYFGHGFRPSVNTLRIYMYEVRNTDTTLISFFLERME